MRARIADEAGVGLIELVVAMALSVVVLGATLTVFDGVWSRQRSLDQHAEAQDGARAATDALARDLRGATAASGYGGPASLRPEAIERTDAFDLVFKAVADRSTPTAGNPTSLERVRYCLDATAGVLRRQVQAPAAFTSAPPATSGCAATASAGWSTSRVVAANVVNRATGDRPVFAYASDTGDVPYGDAAQAPAITRVRTELAIDPDPQRAPRETRLQTSVALRNQNRAPTARLELVVENLTARKVVLDGSASLDPESAGLAYEWFDGASRIGTGWSCAPRRRRPGRTTTPSAPPTPRASPPRAPRPG